MTIFNFSPMFPTSVVPSVLLGRAQQRGVPASVEAQHGSASPRGYYVRFWTSDNILVHLGPFVSIEDVTSECARLLLGRDHIVKK